MNHLPHIVFRRIRPAKFFGIVKNCPQQPGIATNSGAFSSCNARTGLKRRGPLACLPLCAGFAAVLLGGCAHTAPEPAPLQNIQTEWENAPQPPTAKTADFNTRWWETFNDPVFNQLIDMAGQNNLDLRLAALRVMEARAIQRGSEAGLWPQLTGSLGGGRSRSVTRGTQSNFSAGLEAVWEVDVSGRLSALARAARAGFAATEADAQAIRLSLLAEVGNAYVQYRLQHLLLTITQESVRLQERTQKITEQRYQAGMASQLDVQRGKSQLAQTRSQGAEAVLAAETARFVLAYLLAVTPDQLAQIIGADSNTWPQADALTVLLTPLEVLEQRPDIRAALARYAATAAQHDAAVAERLPRLTLGGLIGLENDKLSDIFEGRQLVWNAAGNLAAPILDFGRRASAAEAADARRLQAQVAYEQTVRNALRQTQTAIVGYVQNVIRHEELSAALTAATQAAQVASYQYEEGVLSQLEVIDAEKTLRQARRQWALSGASVSQSLIELYRVMGIGS